MISGHVTSFARTRNRNLSSSLWPVGGVVRKKERERERETKRVGSTRDCGGGAATIAVCCAIKGGISRERIGVLGRRAVIYSVHSRPLRLYELCVVEELFVVRYITAACAGRTSDKGPPRYRTYRTAGNLIQGGERHLAGPTRTGGRPAT